MSRKVTLRKAAQVPLRGAIRPSGFTATVDDETFQSLSARGLIAEEAPEGIEGSFEPEPEGDPFEEAGRGPEDAPATPDSTSSGDLPPMTASLAVWREAAEKIGIKTASMKKPEIIGAVKAHLNK